MVARLHAHPHQLVKPIHDISRLVQSDRAGKKAGCEVVGSHFHQLGLFFATDIFCIETAGVEAASVGRIYRTGDVSLEDYPSSREGGIGYGRC